MEQLATRMRGTAREKIDLSALVEEIAAAARIEAEASDRYIELTLAFGLDVIGDPILLREALENILRNALRNTPAGGRIDIVTTAEAAQVNIVIADTGDTGDTGNGVADTGHGRGLALAHRVAQAHNGSVQAENRPTGGLTVTLSLPMAD